MFSQASIILSKEGEHAWQGNVHGWGVAGGHAWQGTCVAGGGVHGMHGGVTCMAGGMRRGRDSHCSGRYASYWNAFLF